MKEKLLTIVQVTFKFFFFCEMLKMRELGPKTVFLINQSISQNKPYLSQFVDFVKIKKMVMKLELILNCFFYIRIFIIISLEG